MNRAERTITFREREFKGSRLRCLLLTSQSATDVSRFLTSLVAPHAQVPIDARWAPRGFLAPDDAYSGDCDRLFRPNVTGDSAGSAL